METITLEQLIEEGKDIRKTISYIKAPSGVIRMYAAYSLADKMGMKKGDILVFVKDSSTEVSVVDEKKVMYQGDVYSLTGITKKLLNITHAIQPTGYWMFEGKSLRDIYDETYTLDD